MIIRGSIAALLRPGERRDFRDAYQQYGTELSFLREGNMDEAEIRAVAMSALGRQARKKDVGPITYIDPKTSPERRFHDDEWALGYQVSRRSVEDDLYGKVKNPSWLARATKLTQNYQAASVLNDAFTGSVYTGLLSEALISASHTLLNGTTTWSNSIGALSLGITSYAAMLELADAQVDHEGHPMPMKISRLVIDRTDEMMAIQITQNPNEPFTADRNINAAMKKSGSMSYILSHYKTADGHWFGQDPSLLDAWFLFRIKPEFGDDEDKGNTLAARFWCRQRIATYFFDQRGWLGANP